MALVSQWIRLEKFTYDVFVLVVVPLSRVENECEGRSRDEALMQAHF